MTKREKTELSFNDLSFRIPGLILLIVGMVVEYFTPPRSICSIHITDWFELPGFLTISFLGLGMFISPYLLMAYNIYKKGKNDGT